MDIYTHIDDRHPDSPYYDPRRANHFDDENEDEEYDLKYPEWDEGW